VNTITAMSRLERMVAASTDPVLDEAALQDLMVLAARVDAAGNSPQNLLTAPSWAATTTHGVNTVIRQDAITERWWQVLTPGTTGAAAPTWPTFTDGAMSGSQVVDGSIVWVDAGTRWHPTYDLNAAACFGWEQKAAACADRFKFAADSQSYDRQQVNAMCLEMATRYANRRAGVVRFD
jgi:hypothetical protein